MPSALRTPIQPAPPWQATPAVAAFPANQDSANPPFIPATTVVYELAATPNVANPFIPPTTVLYALEAKAGVAVGFIAATTVVNALTLSQRFTLAFIAGRTVVATPRLALPIANVVAPTMSGSFAQGGTVTASTGVWTGSLPLTYTYQWQRCNSGGTSCVDIAGATSSSYLVIAADVAGTLKVRVTASNS